MIIPPNWRDRPASMLEEVFTVENGGKMPTTPEEMIDILQRRRWTIVPMEPELCREAISNLDRRLLFLPVRSREQMFLDLFHEAAEFYLRQPIQPEFHYLDTGEDEFHNVATATTLRMQRTLRETRERLIRARAATESEIQRLEAERNRLAQAFIAFGQAVASGTDSESLTLPDPGALPRTQAALRVEKERLAAIHHKLAE